MVMTITIYTVLYWAFYDLILVFWFFIWNWGFLSLLWLLLFSFSSSFFFVFFSFMGFPQIFIRFFANVYSFSANVCVFMCYLVFLIQVQKVCKDNGVCVYYYCLLLILFYSLMILSDFCRRSSVVPLWRFWSKFQKVFWRF